MDIHSLLNPASPEIASAILRRRHVVTSSSEDTSLPAVTPVVQFPPVEAFSTSTFTLGGNTALNTEPMTRHTPHQATLVHPSTSSFPSCVEQSDKNFYESMEPRRDSDDSATIPVPHREMELLNSPAPVGIAAGSQNNNTVSSDAPSSSADSRTPSLTTDNSAPSTPAEANVMGQPHALLVQNNTFTAVNGSLSPNAVRQALAQSTQNDGVYLGWVDEGEDLIAEVKRAEKLGKGNPKTEGVKGICAFEIEPGKACNYAEPKERKAISHIFGRNKKSTLKLGPSIYIIWCRKHYQRAHYRGRLMENFGTCQTNLLVGTLERMEESNAVVSFDIQLRAREVLRRQAEGLRLPGNVKIPKAPKPKPLPKSPSKRNPPKMEPAPVPEWMVTDYCGNNKSFGDVRAMLEKLKAENVREQSKIGPGLHVCVAVWPDIELVPNVRPGWNEEAAEALGDTEDDEGDEGDRNAETDDGDAPNEKDAGDDSDDSETISDGKRKRGSKDSGRVSPKKQMVDHTATNTLSKKAHPTKVRGVTLGSSPPKRARRYR